MKSDRTLSLNKRLTYANIPARDSTLSSVVPSMTIVSLVRNFANQTWYVPVVVSISTPLCVVFLVLLESSPNVAPTYSHLVLNLFAALSTADSSPQYKTLSMITSCCVVSFQAHKIWDYSEHFLEEQKTVNSVLKGASVHIGELFALLTFFCEFVGQFGGMLQEGV
eukprot:PhF_6_TR8771/c1_g2_i9/m.13883